MKRGRAILTDFRVVNTAGPAAQISMDAHIVDCEFVAKGQPLEFGDTEYVYIQGSKMIDTTARKTSIMEKLRGSVCGFNFSNRSYPKNR